MKRFGNQVLTTAQRDRLLKKADQLQDRANASLSSRPDDAPASFVELRFSKVAGRLRRFVAGVERWQSLTDAWDEVWVRHMEGATTYSEFIEEARWAGYPAVYGRTQLSPQQEHIRQCNLNRIKRNRSMLNQIGIYTDELRASA